MPGPDVSHDKQVEPLSLLRGAITTSGVDEVDAIYRAASRILRAHPDYLRKILDVKMLDPTLYLLLNRTTGNSIVARVTPLTRGPITPSNMPEPMRTIMTRVLGAHTGPEKEYIVTFYPQSLRRQM